MEIKVSKLRKHLDVLNSLLCEYEKVKLNLFNQLKDSCVIWQDGNSANFESKVYLDKKETDLFFNSINSQKKIFDYLYEKYDALGKKVECDLNSQSKLINAIDNCYNQVGNLVELFNDIDTTFYYSEQQSIFLQKNKIIDTKNKLLELKKNIVNIYKNIEKIENIVNKKIKELEEIKINDFDFTLNNSNTKFKNSILDISTLEKNIKQIEFYNSEEENLINNFYQEIFECNNEYNSTNATLILHNIENIKSIANKLSTKRMKYITILSNVINQYDSLSEVVEENFENTDGVL